VSRIPDRKQAPATDTASPPVAREWFSDPSGLGNGSIVIADPEWDEAFRSVCHPSWQWAECQARQWAAEVGLVVGEAERRRHTITVLPLLDVVERAQPGEAALEVLREATADTIVWTNDLASAGRELREGHENLVSVLAREHRGDRDEAAAIGRAMISRRMDDFDAAATAVLAAGPGQAGLRPRVQAIRAFRDGALSWQGETHRNRTGENGPARPASGGATTATAPVAGMGTGPSRAVPG
jgi:Terpene synthase family 2, C-terminal metal binding